MWRASQNARQAGGESQVKRVRLALVELPLFAEQGSRVVRLDTQRHDGRRYTQSSLAAPRPFGPGACRLSLRRFGVRAGDGDGESRQLHHIVRIPSRQTLTPRLPGSVLRLPYHGVLAPNAKLRYQVIALGHEQGSVEESISGKLDTQSLAGPTPPIRNPVPNSSSISRSQTESTPHAFVPPV